MNYLIRLAKPEEFQLFGAIESAAGKAFIEAGLPEIASHEPTDIKFIEANARSGAVFVSVLNDRPVGFILAAPLDRHIHIFELSVHPDHGRKGLGRSLVEAVCDWARENGSKAVTLSTFRDIVWNAPFYASCGFRILSEDEWTPALLLAHYHEDDIGLPLDRRCFMRKELL